ncbi:MAG: protease [Oligoflexia bacterium]|nr:protease [Oligoflexia bacterium]
MKKSIFLLAISLLSLQSASASPILNLDDYVRTLNLNSLYAQTPVKRLKIAVLDNGFAGFQNAITQGALPPNTQYIAGQIPNPNASEKHGLVMAELLYGLLTHDGAAPEFAPAQFLLYNAYGYTNFSAAVKDLIAKKVDLVLYAQNWEYGGNLDGHGFIDAVVAQATTAGILWVNSAGDFGDTTYNSQILPAPGTLGEDGWAQLPGPNRSVQIRCAPSGASQCMLRLVLSWNDFKDDVSLGTQKDLDLILTDDELNIVGASELVQVQTPSNLPGQSLYPREIIEVALKPGLYYARVKIKSQNFGANDKLRLTASGDFISMVEHSSDESLLVPADRSDVIAVGATDTAKSSRSVSLGKPDVSTISLIRLSANEQYEGTSSASAAIAATLALIASENPAASRDDLLNALKSQAGFSSPISNGPIGPGAGLPPNLLSFSFTGPGCYIPLDPIDASAPAYVRTLLAEGGMLVLTTTGQKIFFLNDPIQLFPQIHRQLPNDIIAVGPQGAGLYPRYADRSLPASLYEVIQIPRGQWICGPQ